MKQELYDFITDAPVLLILGLVGAFFDGIAIAQCWDWITTTGRMSIWVLL